MNWVPNTVLVESLSGLDIDIDIIDNIHFNINKTMLINEVMIRRAYTYTAIKKQEEREYKIDVPLRNENLQISRIDKNWHASNKAIDLLIRILSVSRSELANHRHEFLKEYKGKGFHRWDYLFITYVIEKTSSAKSDTAEYHTIPESYTYHENEKLKEYIEYLTHIFSTKNIYLKDNWMPPIWLVKKMNSEGIKNDFIYDKCIVKAFIGNFNSKSYKNADTPSLYYEWVKSRHKKRLL